MTTTIEELKTLTFGIEIEYTGVNRAKIAKLIAEVTGGTITGVHGHLDATTITMPDGRKWAVEGDASVTGSHYADGGEVVTPVLRIDDMDMVQEVMRKMRHAGARTDHTCGQHVHVGAKDMTPKQIQNLVRIFYKQEELIFKACGVQERRLRGYHAYASATRTDLLQRIDKIKTPTMENLADAYYKGTDGRWSHYSNARYRALNLHNLWNGSKHTIEFRLFEGTMHPGEMRANVCLALCMVLKAMKAKAASAKNQRNPNRTTSAKYDLRVFLLRLGMNGDYFKNPRKHLMKRMPGSAAWKNGREHGRGE